MIPQRERQLRAALAAIRRGEAVSGLPMFLVPSAGHVEDGNACGLGICVGRLVVEAEFALD